MNSVSSPAETAGTTIGQPAAAPNPRETMHVGVAADHGAVELKDVIVEHLKSKGLQVDDLGTHGDESVDYPDFADVVCRGILGGTYDAGVLLCTTGVGMSIAANRYPGIQASLVCEPAMASLTREHNDSNVLCLSGRSTPPDKAKKIADAWFDATFEGGRHARRVAKTNIATTLTALAKTDPAIAGVVVSERKRQQEHIELIASENFASAAVREAQGSHLTNKYAEGYPGRRWYGGCEFVDEAERLAIQRACALFGAQFANVQPHSGSQANAAVYFSFLKPGDRILTMDLSHGGHLTHGHQANFSGQFYQVSHYGVSATDERIDYDALQRQAEEVRPRMITAGASAYSRIIDFARMAKIARSVDAMLFVDMAHIAGLVAAGAHPSPLPHADVVTSTTHKSLRGPRGGLILTNNEGYAKKLNAMVFPGVQGGPLMHVIAAKAVCFGEALRPDFKVYQQQVVKNAARLAGQLAERGFRIVSGGTDNHLMMVDLRPKGLNGKIAQEALDQAAITVNKNSIPFDTESPFKGGGIRIGTPAVTTRGMTEPEMDLIAGWIDDVLENREQPCAIAAVRRQVLELNLRFPLP